MPSSHAALHRRLTPADKVVAIAASLGGLSALTTVLSALPHDLPAAVLILQHQRAMSESHLAQILESRIALPITAARAGVVIRMGNVYVAPPNYHLGLRPNGALQLTSSPAVNYVRPSADLLFESVAQYSGASAVAVVLTGTGIDGSGGIGAIKRAGGCVIVQDSATSEHFGMPAASIATGSVDYVLPLDDIAPCVLRLLS
jgi:two-component system, chemotaxis family, protein-glutamate methylesterase/glutaminase